MKIQSKK